MPQVSVIIAGFNCAETLARTCDSLAAQTWSDWEAVIVDDASTDDTPALLRRLLRAEPRLRAMRLPRNQGSAVARNVAVRLARGEWLAILDADDLWCPDKLARQLAALAAVPGAVWSCHAVDWRRGDELLFTQTPPAPAAMSTELALCDHAIAHSSLMIRRDVFRRLGGYRSNLRRSQDWDLLLRLATAPAAPPPVVLSERLSSYTVRSRHLRWPMVRAASRCQGQILIRHLARDGRSLTSPRLAGQVVTSYFERLVEWSEVTDLAVARIGTAAMALLLAPHQRWRWRRFGRAVTEPRDDAGSGGLDPPK